MLENAQDDMGDYSENITSISDDEIDQMIYGTGGASGVSSDISLDDELLALQRELNK